MAKLITFKTPVMDKKTQTVVTEERQGYVALLYVGNYQEKFMLQVARRGETVEALVHYASGYKFGDLASIKLRYARSYQTMTDRAAAKELIKDCVTRLGANAVLEKMRAAPVLND